MFRTPTTLVRYALLGELYHRDIVVHVPVVLLDRDHYDQLSLDWDQNDRHHHGHHEPSWIPGDPGHGQWEWCFDDQYFSNVE